ncbi:hypothetical protein BD769DRAFT_1661566 [Suillus cothurnatus]|nr:hypothetical protein BD769DRAFT_1661566 [Suillus cothurnatus]
MSATTIGFQTAQVNPSLSSSHDFTTSINIVCLTMEIVGAMAAVVFDYWLTISQKVQLIWGTKWNVIKVMFTLARYAALIGTAMTTYVKVHKLYNFRQSLIQFTSDKHSRCRRLAYFSHTCLLASEQEIASVTSRPCCGAVGVSEVVKTLHLDDSPENRTGCMFESGKDDVVQYIFLIIYELVLVILTLYKIFNFYKGVRGRLVTTIYRDGMIYMTCTIMASIANIYVILAVPPDYTAIMDALSTTRDTRGASFAYLTQSAAKL